MAGQTHVLLDFFGTIVDYSPSRTTQGYHASHALVRRLGAEIEYAEFLSTWVAVSEQFDTRSDLDDSEFSMAEVATAFLARVLRRPVNDAETLALVDSYLGEWNAGVVYPAYARESIEVLASRFRLGVVTNTHQAALVPSHLAAMGIADRFDLVLTSVEVGWRKPHPAVYATALQRLDIAAEQAVFVGDNYVADYAGPTAAGMSSYLIDPTSQTRRGSIEAIALAR